MLGKENSTLFIDNIIICDRIYKKAARTSKQGYMMQHQYANINFISVY